MGRMSCSSLTGMGMSDIDSDDDVLIFGFNCCCCIPPVAIVDALQAS